LELRHLRYFIAVAEELNFTRAAERLGIGQPRLSGYIRELEREVGAPLFERTTRHVNLTPAGSVFLEDARKTLAQAAMATTRARLASEGKAGTLQVGFSEPAIYEVLPRHLRAFREQRPDVEIALHELTGAQQVRALLEGEIQLAYIRPSGSLDITGEVVADERLMIVLPSVHPLAELNEVPLEMLERQTLILPPREVSPVFYDQVMGLLHHAHVSWVTGPSVMRTTTILGLVGGNLGFSIQPSSHQQLGGSHVVFRPIVGTETRISLCLSWRTGHDSPLVVAYREICLATDRAAGG
jgi:DNA-binding transcriptional LysR family regulator